MTSAKFIELYPCPKDIQSENTRESSGSRLRSGLLTHEAARVGTPGQR